MSPPCSADKLGAGAPANSLDEFRSLWFDDWGFDASDRPEDAVSYLSGALRTIDSPRSDRDYIENIGAIDGQQKFVFQWLRRVGLVELDKSGYRLSKRGYEVLRLLDTDSYYEAFGLGI